MISNKVHYNVILTTSCAAVATYRVGGQIRFSVFRLVELFERVGT